MSATSATGASWPWERWVTPSLIITEQNGQATAIVDAPVFPLAPHATHYPFGYGAEDMPDLARWLASVQQKFPKGENE